MNKIKNGTNQWRFRVMALIGAVFVLILLTGCLLLNMFASPYESSFNRTATSIVATNDHVATLISQTQAAATEQFMLTGTTLP